MVTQVDDQTKDVRSPMASWRTSDATERATGSIEYHP